jgi:hypothetical protein
MAGSRPSTSSVTPWIGSPPQSAIPSGRVTAPPDIVPRVPSPIGPAGTVLPAVTQAGQELPAKPRSRGGLASRFGKLAGTAGGLTSELTALVDGLSLPSGSVIVPKPLPTDTLPTGNLPTRKTYERLSDAVRAHTPVIGEPVLFCPNIESAPELRKRKPRADASLKKLPMPKPLDPAFRVTMPSSLKHVNDNAVVPSPQAAAQSLMTQFGSDTGVRELIMAHLQRSQSAEAALGPPHPDPFRFTITGDGEVIDSFDMEKFWEEESKPKFELTTVGASHLVAMDASLLEPAAASEKARSAAVASNLTVPASKKLSRGIGAMKYSTALNFVTPGRRGV